MRLERSQTRVVEKEAKGEGNGDKALHGVKGTKLTRREVLKAAGTGLGGLFILPSCGSGGQQGGSSDTITFGAALSLTGELAKEGKLTRDGYNFYKEWINAHNGIKADGKSYKVDVKVYDDQSDPDQAAQLYQRLITQDDIMFLLGPYGSSATLQSAVISEKRKLPMVEANGASTEIFQQGYKYIFGVLSPAPKYLQPVLDVAANQTGSNAPKRVALIADNDSFSLDVSKGARDYAKSKGFEVVADETVPEGANDVTAVLTGVKRQKPDILLGSGHFSSSVLIIKSARLQRRAIGARLREFPGEGGELCLWCHTMDSRPRIRGSALRHGQRVLRQFPEELRLRAGLPRGRIDGRLLRASASHRESKLARPKGSP
jgi:ABC-type branched-subunit amino acid transport system substrate-binding protein